MDVKAPSRKIVGRRNRLRSRLIATAAKKFAAKGVENVSVEEIIDEAETARSTFYSFYSNKEELLKDVVRPVFERGIEEFSKLETADPVKLVLGIARVYLTLWERDSHALSLAFRLAHKHFTLIEDLHHQYMGAVRELLAAVEDSGILRNGNAHYTSRLIARSAIPILEVYGGDGNYRDLFLQSMRGLLLTSDADGPSRDAGE